MKCPVKCAHKKNSIEATSGDREGHATTLHAHYTFLNTSTSATDGHLVSSMLQVRRDKITLSAY